MQTARTSAQLTPYASASDAELAGRAANGDEAAFECIMRRHNRLLFRTARSILKVDAEAEDALQETYLRAWRALPRFRADAKLSTWLVRIVINEALGRMRRRGAQVVPLHDTAEPAEAQALRSTVGEGDAEHQPDRAAMRTEMRRLIEARIDMLPESFRTVFMLRAVEELAVEEVAAALEVPEATVRTRFFRARGLLREGLARDLDLAIDDAFPFAGARCDRIVARLLAKLAETRERRQEVIGRLATLALLTLAVALAVVGCSMATRSENARQDALVGSSDIAAAGRQVFRFDAFGDEQFWTDTARLHEVIDKEMQPLEALRLGLKVDLDNLKLGRFLLHNPFAASGTRELLRQNAVVGVQASFGEDGKIARIGITCALCHSTVDNALLPGIGRRLDGWPNATLDIGAIIARSAHLTTEQKAVYRSWGPGKYDPRFNIDGQSTPLVLPPAYGLAGVRNATYTADGSISYWNAYVATTQMHGKGSFSEPRLGIDVKHSPDLVTPKLQALLAYQHTLTAPPPPAGSFDAATAERGRVLFSRTCATCHVGGSGTDNNDGRLHAAAETGVDGAYAARTATKAYRTTPLRALWQHAPYFHDGSAATLADVVTHYNRVRMLGLTVEQQLELVEYLKSL